MVSIAAHQPGRGAIVLLDLHRQIDPDEPPLIDDPTTMNESEVDRGRRAQHGCRYRIVKGAGVSQPIETEGDEIGALPRLERTNVLPTEDGRAAARRRP